MKIYFVRHGHPDYSKNCLTELGHKQAAAAALSLKNGVGYHCYCAVNKQERFIALATLKLMKE